MEDKDMEENNMRMRITSNKKKKKNEKQENRRRNRTPYVPSRRDTTRPVHGPPDTSSMATINCKYEMIGRLSAREISGWCVYVPYVLTHDENVCACASYVLKMYVHCTSIVRSVYIHGMFIVHPLYVQRTYLFGAPYVVVCGQSQLPPYRVGVISIETRCKRELKERRCKRILSERICSCGLAAGNSLY